VRPDVAAVVAEDRGLALVASRWSRHRTGASPMCHLRLSAALVSASLGLCLVLPATLPAQQVSPSPDGSFGGGSLVEWLSQGVELPAQAETRTPRKRTVRAARTVIEPAAQGEQRPGGRQKRSPPASPAKSEPPRVQVQRTIRPAQRIAKRKGSDQTVAEPTKQAESTPTKAPGHVLASFAREAWWQQTGRSMVFRLRDCLSSYGASRERPAEDETLAAIMISAIETDCQKPFDDMLRTLAEKADRKTIEPLIQEMTRRTFLPALKNSARIATQ